jgi:hypothetical protein
MVERLGVNCHFDVEDPRNCRIAAVRAVGITQAKLVTVRYINSELRNDIDKE